MDMHTKKLHLQAVICWSLLLPSSKPYPGADNPGDTAELCLREPKSAQSKGGNLAAFVVVDRERRCLVR